MQKLTRYLRLYLIVIASISLGSFYWVYVNVDSLVLAFSQGKKNEEELALELSRKILENIPISEIKLDTNQRMPADADYNLITENIYSDKLNILIRRKNQFFRYTGKHEAELKKVLQLKQDYLSSNSTDLYQSAFLIFAFSVAFIFVLSLLLIVFLSHRIKRNMVELSRSLKENSDEAEIDFYEFSYILKEFKKYQAKAIQIERQHVVQDVLSRWQMEVKKIVHDLKNPLQRIKLSLSDNDESEQNKLALSALDEIQFNLKNIKSTELAHEIDPQKIDLPQFFERIKKLFYDIEIDLVSSLNTDFCFDEHAFQRIVSNLIQNAIEANASTISFSFFREDGKSILEITNNGERIKDSEKLFVPFSTSKKDGSGLGLVIVLQFVHMHNARIFLKHSREDETQFRMELA